MKSSGRTCQVVLPASDLEAEQERRGAGRSEANKGSRMASEGEGKAAAGAIKFDTRFLVAVKLPFAKMRRCSSMAEQRFCKP